MLKLMEKFGFDSKYLLALFGVLMLLFAFSFFDLSSNRVVGFMFATAPIWAPIITFFLFFEYWMYYVKLKYDINQGRTTLEIKLPQEILKSPEAMEMVLIQMHQVATPDNHVQTYWDGKHPPMYSLELVSNGGDVKFYINTPKKKFKNLIETQLYAQYPGIEVVELDVDYTAEVTFDLNKFSMFSLHFGLKKADAYPLKTYIDFGLHTMPKEEEKTDPIASMLETLGSIGPGEYYWVQILIEANREVDFLRGSFKTKPDWKDDARKEIKKIVEEANKRVGVKIDKEKGTTLNMLNLSEGEKDAVKAIERSLGKNAFNTVIRGMYIAKSDAFNPGERIGTLITGFKAYDDLNRNAIGVRWRTDFDWNWWQDPTGKRKDFMRKKELFEYKARRYTSWSGADKPKVMTTEELATIFHLPGQVAMTPTLGRIPSKRSEAPSNLPVE